MSVISATALLSELDQMLLPVTVQYETRDGSAKQGIAYEKTDGILVWLFTWSPSSRPSVVSQSVLRLSSLRIRLSSTSFRICLQVRPSVHSPSSVVLSFVHPFRMALRLSVSVTICPPVRPFVIHIHPMSAVSLYFISLLYKKISS